MERGAGGNSGCAGFLVLDDNDPEARRVRTPHLRKIVGAEWGEEGEADNFTTCGPRSGWSRRTVDGLVGSLVRG